MEDEEYLEELLKKYRTDTMTREEFEYLSEYMERPEAENRIKRLLDKHWQEMEGVQDDDSDE